ncbi:MAG: hypothetical protein CM1200mP2_45360 [Planctomycetaceae bacterium]|nr:MAG: hypothetical protein CM1200mP2_45360 [Planctomycetaceae bacterium]
MGSPVVRYMYKAYENDPAKRDLDNKPFHHVFDPAGTRLLTKGTGGLYTHHQGLFYGFTRCTFPGGKCKRGTAMKGSTNCTVRCWPRRRARSWLAIGRRSTGTTSRENRSAGNIGKGPSSPSVVER